MRSEYERWLRDRGYNTGTILAQLYRVERVEEHYGDFDLHFATDRLASILQVLRYTSDDERKGKPNPTLIPFVGVIRTNLAAYRGAVGLYLKFLLLADGDEVSGLMPNPLASSVSRSKPTAVNPKTLAEFGFNGLASFQSIIATSQYATMAQAVASLTVFTHPDTVRQTGGQAIFLSVRNPRRVGEIAEIGGRAVMLDDNKSPTDAFLWANRMSQRGADTQFNHIYAASGDPDAYTALPNICMTPAFIAKLTDTSPEVRALLRFRSYDLYGWLPSATEPPLRPESYDSLEWSSPLDPVYDVQQAIEDAMRRKPKDRTVKSASKLGWLFDKKQHRP